MSGRAPARLRNRLRRAAFGLATVLGFGRRGFFIPYRYAGRMSREARPSYPAVAAIFDGAAERFAQALRDLDAYAAPFEAIGRDAGGPRWDQDWFPRLDAALAYALVRRHRPGRIVEVGCGHSTRFLARAAADGATGSRITAIDPAPRAALEGLAVEFLRAAVPKVGPGPFAGLAPGDMLVVDSSHVLMPGTDVDFLLTRIVPALPAGALLHVHDVFLPDDYPEDWAWRGYNEQAAVALLVASGGWEVLFASHYVATRMGDAVTASVAGRLPLLPGARESSLWLRRASG